MTPELPEPDDTTKRIAFVAAAVTVALLIGNAAAEVTIEHTRAEP